MRTHTTRRTMLVGTAAAAASMAATPGIADAADTAA
ncbi:twin-arginine translocation signal domain-containing protein, partial [Streptomyces hainanensis]